MSMVTTWMNDHCVMSFAPLTVLYKFPVIIITSM